MPGFIQDIGLDPVFIHYWNKDSLTFWNNFCWESVAFLDATGSMVRKTKTGSKMLYYELTVQHPYVANTSLPVAMMLTERQDQPHVTDFLNKFRHSEKLLKGHSYVKQPLQINTDWSVVMINSVLNVFNNESMQTYLQRCWIIVTGTAEQRDFMKTTLHICLSYHMNLMKRKCLSISKQRISH